MRFMARPSVSGFTVIKNAQIMGYPLKESLLSLLPLVDEMVVAVGAGEDKTREIVEGLNSPKVKIFDTIWDKSKTKGGLLLSEKTNEALELCSNDWCFYLQADEVLHEKDSDVIHRDLALAAQDPEVEALLFGYVHFYGNYSTVATNRTWYRNEIRLFRKSSGAKSFNDAQGFRIFDKDSERFTRKLKVLRSRAQVYHYGWVKPPQQMGEKSKQLNRLWHGTARDQEFQNFQYKIQYGLKPFTGIHPEVMRHLIESQNWDFAPRYPISQWTLKDWNLFASDVLERLTGYRIGEYKPYKVIR